MLSLKDRYNKTLIAKSVCKYCYSLILNGQPLYLGDMKNELGRLCINRFRLEFNRETAQEAEAVFKSFKNADRFEGDFTRGHFQRGVE